MTWKKTCSEKKRPLKLLEFLKQFMIYKFLIELTQFETTGSTGKTFHREIKVSHNRREKSESLGNLFPLSRT